MGLITTFQFALRDARDAGTEIPWVDGAKGSPHRTLPSRRPPREYASPMLRILTHPRIRTGRREFIDHALSTVLFYVMIYWEYLLRTNLMIYTGFRADLRSPKPGAFLPFSKIRRLSKCVMISFGYHACFRISRVQINSSYSEISRPQDLVYLRYCHLNRFKRICERS